MVSRRIVRGEKNLDPSEKLLFQKSGSFSLWIYTFFRGVWIGVKIIWYWIERIFLILLLIGLTIGLAWWTSQKPSLYRDWETMDAIFPTMSWSGESVTIQNIRDHIWTSEDEFIPNYRNATYNLKDIEGVYYVITPFSDKDGPAHTMLTFSFSGGQHLAISAELRKERGEGFDALKGILNQFEIQYVVATEDDVIKLRTNYRNNQVYMYPINTPKEKIQLLFRSMLLRADKLNKEPEFYNTLWNNCTTSILYHANALRKEKLSGGKYTLLPSHSDEIVYAAGLIDTRLSLPEAREYYMVSDSAKNAINGAIFSEVIRKEKR